MNTQGRSVMPVFFSPSLLLHLSNFLLVSYETDNVTNCLKCAAVNDLFNNCSNYFRRHFITGSCVKAPTECFQSLSCYRSTYQPLSSLDALCKLSTVIRSGICSTIVVFF